MTDPAQDPAWARLLALARRSLERTGGSLDTTITLPAPDEAERLLIIGITGIHRLATAGRIAVRLSELDAYLQQAHGLGLVAVLGGTLRNRPAERHAAVRARDAMLAQARTAKHHDDEWFQRWLIDLQRDGTTTRLIRAGRDLEPAIRVLNALPADDEPLPVFAERLLGDTKALTDPALRTMLNRAIALWRAIDLPANGEEERQLWESVGVIPDDLASQVLVLNLPAGGGPVGTWLTQAAQIGCPMRLTLHQLRLHALDIEVEHLFVTENPAILRAACATYGPSAPPMICTEGVPSAAAHQLLKHAAAATVWWRNDFDWAGVRMTTAALTRYPRLRPWRMSAADYRSAAGSGQPLLGTPATTPWDPHLATEMMTIGKSVMEERLLPELLADLGKRYSAGGEP
jgi:uncharacterized protein (TIGR02679 family)